MNLLSLLFCLIVSVSSLTLPEGFKPSKAFGQNTDVIVPTAPSREKGSDVIENQATAANNEAAPQDPPTQQSKNEENPSGIVILKRKKSGGVKEVRKPVRVFTAEPITVPQPRSEARRPLQVPTSANYGLQTVVQTNLVGSDGKILKNVVAVPIRIAPKKVVSSTPGVVVSQVEGEGHSEVAVRFGQAQ